MLCENEKAKRTLLEMGVLILVLMEDALRVNNLNDIISQFTEVLILVLMEDALRVLLY